MVWGFLSSTYVVLQGFFFCQSGWDCAGQIGVGLCEVLLHGSRLAGVGAGRAGAGGAGVTLGTGVSLWTLGALGVPADGHHVETLRVFLHEGLEGGHRHGGRLPGFARFVGRVLHSEELTPRDEVVERLPDLPSDQGLELGVVGVELLLRHLPDLGFDGLDCSRHAPIQSSGHDAAVVVGAIGEDDVLAGCLEGGRGRGGGDDALQGADVALLRRGRAVRVGLAGVADLGERRVGVEEQNREQEARDDGRGRSQSRLPFVLDRLDALHGIHLR